MRECRMPWCNNEVRYEGSGTRNNAVCEECHETYCQMLQGKNKTMGAYMSQMWKTAKERAVKKDIPFDLEVQDLYDILPEDGCCPIFGQPFKCGGGAGSKWAMSLDKIVPELGYVKGNVRWISMLANRMYSNATDEELLTFAYHVIEELE